MGRRIKSLNNCDKFSKGYQHREHRSKKNRSRIANKTARKIRIDFKKKKDKIKEKEENLL